MKHYNKGSYTVSVKVGAKIAMTSNDTYACLDQWDRDARSGWRKGTGVTSSLPPIYFEWSNGCRNSHDVRDAYASFDQSELHTRSGSALIKE